MVYFSSDNSSDNKMFLSKTSLLLRSRPVQSLPRKLLLKMSTVSASMTLPQLPVPVLEQTLDKYLKSVQPFLDSSELETTKKLLKDFQCNQGPKLQRLLVEKAKFTDNWLADWWLNVAYLEYRDPVVVYSSPGLVFPFQNFQSEEERLNYTAKLISAALAYRELIDSGKMKVEKMGKEPLDMNQYNKIFGTCRIPGLRKDSLEFNPQSKHIVVAKNNNFFKVPVINSEHKPLSVFQLVSILQEIVDKSTEPGAPIGVLTADYRNNWGRAYQDLILDVQNLKSVREIQTALFLVCLDNPMPKCEERKSTASHQLIHGGGGCAGNAGNRWYDKTLQFIIGCDGTNGLTYEHSPSEGQPIAVMTDFLINHIKQDESINIPDIRFDGQVQLLNFNLNQKIFDAVRTAQCTADKLANNLEMDAFQFTNFGKNFIKSQKLSPDSFIQMAMQYAFYRLHNTPAAHYESAATRKYIHGRTETIRSCSIESVKFAQVMLANSCNDGDKVSAMKEAINAHKKYTIEAINGFGVDRHLLGLKLIAIESGFAVPDLFKDAAFVKSTHMRLSTSQVATKCDGFMCYGPLTVDGYGCCYNPRDEDINFAISSFVECKETSAGQFREALCHSLNDMYEVLVRTQKSKL